jgi:phosphatidylglycerophosphatase A
MYKNYLAKAVSSLCFVGFSRYAPGTMGSLVTAILFFLLFKYDLQAISILLLILSVVFGLWSTNQYLIDTKSSDPKEVVIDEFVGQAVSILGSWYLLDISGRAVGDKLMLFILLNFIFFRIFDILKPFPVSYFDRIDNAFGVMMDDIVAGMMSSIVVISIFFYIVL